MLHLVLLCHSAGDGRRPRNHVQGCGSLESYNREACSTASGKRAPQVPNTKCLYTNMEAENIQIYNADMFFFFFFLMCGTYCCCIYFSLLFQTGAFERELSFNGDEETSEMLWNSQLDTL